MTIQSTQLIKALVENNYDLAITLMTAKSVNKPTSKGLYPIHYIVKIRPEEISPGVITMLIEALAKHGANLNQPDYFYQTPLMLSIHHFCMNDSSHRSNKEAFDFLIENLSSEQINYPQEARSIGQTSLFIAAQNSNRDFKLYGYFIEKLIEKGADKNIKDEIGRNPFDVASHPIAKEILSDNPPYSKELFDQVNTLIKQNSKTGDLNIAFSALAWDLKNQSSSAEFSELSSDLITILNIYGKHLDLKSIFYALGDLISGTSSNPEYQRLIEQFKHWITSNYTKDAFSRICDNVLTNGHTGERLVFRNLSTQWPEFCGDQHTTDVLKKDEEGDHIIPHNPK